MTLGLVVTKHLFTLGKNIWNKVNKSKKTGHEAPSLIAYHMSPPKLEIFPILPDFQKFKVLSCSVIVRQLLYQVCYARYQVSLSLWRTGAVLRHCKVLKYYDEDCRQYQNEISVRN